MDLTKYQKIFVQESEKYLMELDRLLIDVEKDLSNKDLWTEIHGKLHSIKGMARALSLEKITDLSHSMEDWCKMFQQGELLASSDIVQFYFDGEDLLKMLVSRMGDISSPEDQRWYDTVIGQFKKGPKKLSKPDKKQKKSPTTKSVRPAEKIDSVRVKYSLVEELLGISQEIMLIEKSLPPLSLEQVSRGLQNWINDYISMLKGLHFRLAQLRLISVGDFADIFVKTVRDLAKENKKEVRFKVKGGDMEADVTLLDRLREPFIHLFRNSIAHGIEAADERVQLGKKAEGTITLEATRERDSLITSISDDGRGIDRSTIAEYLKQKRSMTDKDIEKMSEEEFFNTILNPDFTTASKATDMAGRGIGMNLVAQAIEYLGGNMTIHSEQKKGTEFIIKLPVSLSIIYAITFRVGDYTVSIPTSNVLSIDKRDLSSLDEENSFYDLMGLFGVKRNGKKLCHVIKLTHAGRRYSGKEEEEINVIVDSVIGNKRVMVMPIGEILAKARLFAGVGVMEDGEISVLLDVESLPENPK